MLIKFPPSEVPSTKVGQASILAVSPFMKIWCRNNTVSELRKMELRSSWEQGGFLEDAAILKGLRKHDTNISNWSTYSSSASTIRNTRLCMYENVWMNNEYVYYRKDVLKTYLIKYLFLFRILSAWGDLMYWSTICFHRRLMLTKWNKICTSIFRISIFLPA